LGHTRRELACMTKAKFRWEGFSMFRAGGSAAAFAAL
jgi:hypothetical protein